MKVCTKCGKEKELEEFHNNKRSKDGKRAQCKLCEAIKQKKYRDKNKEKIAIKQEEWREKNKEKIAARNKKHNKENKKVIAARKKKHYEENKEEILTKRKEYKAKNRVKLAIKDKIWRNNNKGTRNATNARRKAAKLQATPCWYESEKAGIYMFYIKAYRLGLSVDHIAPLQGELVCGLHTLANLQMLTPSENSAKCNKFVVE